MSKEALRHCLSKVASSIELIEAGGVSKALDILNELVVFIAEQMIKEKEEG